MKASKGAYGESAGEWTPADAHGFSKMLALPGIFYTRAGRNRARAPGGGPKKKTVVVDKIASIAQACGLGHELRIATTDIPCEEGVVLVVEVLTNKSTYNPLELTSGRMAKVARGDVIVGALGHRQALFGYSGHVPEKVADGRRAAGAQHRRRAGRVRLREPRKGQALRLPRAGRRAAVPVPRRADRRAGAHRAQPLDPAATLDARGVPVVALAGTCMEAGKTAAACAIVRRMRHRGLAVNAFKATGVSLRRDILAMEDAGAQRSMIFTDLGVVTTTAANGPALTRTMLSEMTQDKPDVVVFELGDGILGAYGVEAILSAPDIRRALSAVILSANDPVAAWGGVKLLRERFDIEPCAVTGPATDNAVGVRIIEEQMGVRACNAMTAGAALGDHILESLGLDERFAQAASE